MKRGLKYLLVAAALGAATVGYTQVMQRVSLGSPPELVPIDQRAESVFVDKSDRVLKLMRDGAVFRTYSIALGPEPEGHKTQEGDGRTPVGDYVLDWRNPKSIAHLSLHISYPNKEDQEQAAARGVSPGGNIMIHGVLNGYGALGRLFQRFDWTNGCIAVTNSDMREIWSHVDNGTPIRIEE